MWHRVAKLLHCTPREAKRRLTSSEFSDYIELFRQEDEAARERTEKWEYYAAELIAEERRSWVTDKDRVESKNFMFKYVEKPIEEEGEEKPPVLTKEQEEANRLAIEKYTWGVITGSLAPKDLRRKTT